MDPVVPARRPRTTWPDDRTATLKRLFDEGKSYLLIAKELGTTKAVVGNKVDREGWTRPATVVVVIPDRTAPRPKPKPPASGPCGLALPLWDLEANGCRFPTRIDGEGTHLFCGEPQDLECSYCAFHRRKALRTSPFAWERAAVEEPHEGGRRGGKMGIRSDGAKWR